MMNEETVICEFTKEGMLVAQRYLGAIRTGGWMPLPSGLLTDHSYVEPLEPEACVEGRSFRSRGEAGAYLADRLKPLGADAIATNTYLWSWIGMFYLEQMTQVESRRPSSATDFTELIHLIDPLNHDSRDRSHHRLKLAYDIWVQYGHRQEEAWILLDEPVNSFSQFALRLAQSPEIFRSKGIVGLAHQLYADRNRGTLRSGAGGQTRATAPAGSLPRLIGVLNQLQMNYDVYGMTPAQLLPLLPPEFDRFKEFAELK